MEPQPSGNRKSIFMAILTAGLIVGTLDIIAASVQTVMNGREVLDMWKFIASGVFGKAALSGGMIYAFLGLFLHYCIATIWSAIFFLIYPRIDWFNDNRIITGVLFGIFVSLCMSQIVLPLSNTPPLPFRWSGFIKGTLILIGAIGIPLAFLTHRYYRKA